MFLVLEQVRELGDNRNRIFTTSTTPLTQYSPPQCQVNLVPAVGATCEFFAAPGDQVRDFSFSLGREDSDELLIAKPSHTTPFQSQRSTESAVWLFLQSLKAQPVR